MSKGEKSVMIERRSDGHTQNITPATWKKMQDSGKSEFFREVTAPAIPKEVSEKIKVSSGGSTAVSGTITPGNTTTSMPKGATVTPTSEGKQ